MSETGTEGVRDTLDAQTVAALTGSRTVAWVSRRPASLPEVQVGGSISDEQGYQRYDKFHGDEGEALADFLKGESD